MASTVNQTRDPNTLSNYNEFVTLITKADLEINFKAKNINGNVTLKLESVSDTETREIILDTSHLEVKDLKIDRRSVKWNVLARVEPYGSALKIDLEEGIPRGQCIEVDIQSETTRSCTALQFLDPAQTRSKHPYMFTQCQAIHARSIFPCQDTPNVKSTYDFRIKSPLPVIASGLPTGIEDLEHGKKLYFYEQKIPIPSYLFALASGEIKQADIGPRSVVATGPKELQAAKWELEESTEKFIQTIEKIIFPYVWGTYNVLILPPSFPYGGMENPVYTYATPTIVSNDRENVDVIAHELSHSYSGNLVSNASWEHFWLNEGWTTYLERRILAAVHGEAHRDFSAIIGWKALQDSVTQFGETHEFTKLIIDLKDKDPDDAFSSIPYEKGYTFLSYLEKQIGKEKWNEFIPHYFEKFARRSPDSYEFKACLFAFVHTDRSASAALEKVDFDSWFYKPGLPPKPEFDTSMVDVCYDLASKWENSHTLTFKPGPEDIKGWSANQIVVFLDRIQDSTSPLSSPQTQSMASTYGFAKSRNVEVSARYFQVALEAKDASAFEPTAKLLSEVGRMKFVRPLYKKLSLVNRALAIETFQQNRDFYHPICRGLVEKDLFGKGTLGL